MSDELKEPFATVILARRGDPGLEAASVHQAAMQALQEAEGQEAAKTGRSDGQALAQVMSWPGWKLI
ncbi:MAG TPA: hypothetical protein VLJ59_04860 [Mycobacteriales bacterium]|nr:hypothetical protein [Mycobacteriales bacterium]